MSAKRAKSLEAAGSAYPRAVIRDRLLRINSTSWVRGTVNPALASDLEQAVGLHAADVTAAVH